MVQKFGLMHIKYWTSHFENLEKRRRKKYGCCCCCWSLDWWRWNGASIKSERVPSSLLHRLISSGPPHLLRPGWTVITFQTFAISIFWDPAHLFLASCHKSLVSGFGKISVQWPICHQVHSLNWQNACSVIKLGCIWICKWDLSKMTFVSETDCSSAAPLLAPGGPFIKWSAGPHHEWHWDSFK